MRGFERRAVLRATAALVGGSVWAQPQMLRAATSGIVIPTAPFVLRRILMRDLARGDRLVVTRDWIGRFHSDGGRTIATGEQSTCTVEAPTVLEPLAALERARRASGPFPAELDALGHIVGAGADAMTDTKTAIAAALNILQEAGKAPADVAAARLGLERLTKMSGAMTDTIPPDLFFPVTGEASESREMALDGGLAGQMVLAVVARAQEGGLLESLDRRIATRIGEDTRETREIWSLHLA